MESLARAGEVLAGCHQGFFYAMDNDNEYLALHEMWDQGQAPKACW
jgi:hypothetical protein